MFKNKYELTILIIIFIIFILIRIPGLDLPYHLDEIKYAGALPIVWNPEGFSSHPPLVQIIFSLTAKLFGPENFRLLPFIFSLANLGLLYYFVRYRYGVRAALWSAILFSVTFYGVLASLTVDLDGAILPFPFLLSLIFYFKWRDGSEGNMINAWSGLFMLSLILGFLIKLSFIIVIGCFLVDFFWDKGKKISAKERIKYMLLFLLIPVFLSVILVFIKYLFPQDPLRTISHAADYFRLSGRSYLQVLIQFVKAMLYASPLLVIPLVFLKRRHWPQFRVFFIYLLFSFLFYFVLFDFSRAALDKYLALLVVPLSIISGVAISELFDIRYYFNKNRHYFFYTAGFLSAGFLIFMLQMAPHYVPPLYPKEEWINRIIQLKWNFVFPFTGGSGPMGFYISWLFMGVCWAVTFILAGLALFKKNLINTFFKGIVIVGILYNAVFIGEYLFGTINGSSSILLKQALNFIEKDDRINKVITYNDIGRTGLLRMGKYERRIYAVPKYELEHRQTLSNFRGHYLVVDIPHINPNSLYGKYFSTCQVIYEEVHRKVVSRVYDCEKAIVAD